MRLSIEEMHLMPFCDKYSSVKQDLLPIAASEHVILQYQVRDIFVACLNFSLKQCCIVF